MSVSAPGMDLRVDPERKTPSKGAWETSVRTSAAKALAAAVLAGDESLIMVICREGMSASFPVKTGPQLRPV